MPNGELNNLMISFSINTSVPLPVGTSVTFPQGENQPITLQGSEISILFPMGSGIMFPEGHNIVVSFPNQSDPYQSDSFDLTSNADGNLVVSFPGEDPIHLPPSPLSAVIPELSTPPMQLPEGSSISSFPGSPPFQLPNPVTVGIRKIKLAHGRNPID
jgi:hypothetical protein